METFQLIINRIFKIEENNFFTYIEGVDYIIRCFFAFNTIHDKHNSSLPLYKIKFNLFKKGLDSFLIKCVRDEEFVSYFCKIQSVYHVLNRFVFRYKYKRAKIVVNTDMILNELQENDKNVICVYQDNSKYLFKIHDLLKIINMALINSSNFFANPLCIKNPYSNLPFGKGILYSIYYFIREKTNITFNTNDTELFFKFHRCHFNLTLFFDEYEYILREKTILNYVKNSTTETLYNDIMIMLHKFNSEHIKKQIVIDKKFPKNRIVEIFQPYLIMYIKSKYLLIPTLKYKATCYLERKLKKFQSFNPIFGRKKVKLLNKIFKNGTIKKINYEDIFDDKHINFYEDDNNDFLKSHLTYKLIHYNTIPVGHYSDDEEDDDATDAEITHSQFIYDHNEEEEEEEAEEEEEENVNLEENSDYDSI
jgi:hypothetical protein